MCFSLGGASLDSLSLTENEAASTPNCNLYVRASPRALRVPGLLLHHSRHVTCDWDLFKCYPRAAENMPPNIPFCFSLAAFSMAFTASSSLRTSRFCGSSCAA